MNLIYYFTFVTFAHLLLISQIKSAIIPKGLSSILINSKIPSKDNVFNIENKVENTNDENNEVNIITPSIEKSSEKEKNDLQHFNLYSLFKIKKPTNSKFFINETTRITALENYEDTYNDFSYEYSNDKTTAILLSKEVIKANIIKKLGIKGTHFRLPSLNKEPSFFPLNTKPMFIFNLKEQIIIDQSKLVGSIPFKLNENYQVEDYNILIPISYMQDLKVSSIYLEDVLNECKNKILFYNQPLSSTTPLLITMINEIDNYNGSTDKKDTKLLNLFFELVSKNLFYLSSTQSIDLLESIFCFTNNIFKHDNDNKSFCLNIVENGKLINLSSFFDLSNKIDFNHITRSPLTKRDLNSSQIDIQFIDSNSINFNTSAKEINFADNGLSFKIQVGDENLTPYKNSFKNITKCLEEEEYQIPEQPLEGSVFGYMKDNINMKIHSSSHSPLLNEPKIFSLNYKL